MPGGVNLYGASLFGGCYKSTIVSGMNNSPGAASASGGGIDMDAAGRLGYKNLATGVKVAGTNKKDAAGNNRLQGICAGITGAWIAAFLGGNAAATDHGEFSGFFTGPLRFQGAYYCDEKGVVATMQKLFKALQLRLMNSAGTKKTLDPASLVNLVPDAGNWAAYVAAYGHAVGIGSKNFRYYLMEPNAGLFEYQNRAKFLTDLRQFLITRKKASTEDSSATFFN